MPPAPPPVPAAPPATGRGTGGSAALGLAALLAAVGVAHLVAPRPFDLIVPRALPGPARAWTVVTGVIELALAAALLPVRTRRGAARLTAGYLVAVLPANAQMALDWADRSTLERAVALGRLPLQVPLVLWAWRLGRGSPTVRVVGNRRPAPVNDHSNGDR